MKPRKLQILLVLATMALAALACGGSFSTANITSAKMAADGDGIQETTVFAQDQIFYCIVKVANAPEDTKVKAVWTAVEVEGEQPNTLLDQTEITAGSQTIFTFDLSNNQLWPTGNYKVDLYLNGELDRTLEFQVQ